MNQLILAHINLISHCYYYIFNYSCYLARELQY